MPMSLALKPDQTTECQARAITDAVSLARLQSPAESGRGPLVEAAAVAPSHWFIHAFVMLIALALTVGWCSVLILVMRWAYAH